MVLRKATAATESGKSPSTSQRAELAQLTEESTRSGVHLVTETLRPSARGRRYKNSSDGRRVIDGPFTESKELIAGYCIVSADSLEEAPAGRRGTSTPWRPTRLTCASWSRRTRTRRDARSDEL